MKQIMKIIIAALALWCIGYISGYRDGQKDNDRAATQTECHARSMEMLHIVWQNHPDVWAEIKQSQAFHEYDSLVNHDWEDFNYRWQQ